MPSVSFIPCTNAGRLLRRPNRTKRCPASPCPIMCAEKPAHRSDASPIPASKPQLVKRGRAGVPTLFNGPEAVLGILLAAAALIAQFTRDLARIASGTSPSREEMQRGLEEVDRSIEVLRVALDGSKQALKETEDQLDESLARANSAEQALQGLGDTREKYMKAMDDAAKAEKEVERIEQCLREERDDMQGNQQAMLSARTEFKSVESEVESRERELLELRKMVEEMKEQGEERLKGAVGEGNELREQIEHIEAELEDVRTEKERIEKNAEEIEKRATTMADQVSAAALALEETRKELERVESELTKRKSESARLEMDTAELEEQTLENDKLREVMRDMEIELRDMQVELRNRDMLVSAVSNESDELRSILAMREAELREVSERLASTIANEMESAGDPRLSDLKLEEIKANLDADQLAFSAEIAKADLVRNEIDKNDIEALERVKKEMGLDDNLFQAALRKAEASVRLIEHDEERRNDAVDDVMQSIEGSDVDVDLQAIMSEASGNGEKEREYVDDINFSPDELDTQPGFVRLEDLDNESIDGGLIPDVSQKQIESKSTVLGEYNSKLQGQDSLQDDTSNIYGSIGQTEFEDSRSQSLSGQDIYLNPADDLGTPEDFGIVQSTSMEDSSTAAASESQETMVQGNLEEKPKKRRGRPRKKKQPDEDNRQQPKRRGRPPKKSSEG